MSKNYQKDEYAPMSEREKRAVKLVQLRARMKLTQVEFAQVLNKYVGEMFPGITGKADYTIISRWETCLTPIGEKYWAAILKLDKKY